MRGSKKRSINLGSNTYPYRETLRHRLTPISPSRNQLSISDFFINIHARITSI